MSSKRKAYILCGEENNERTQFSKTVLENIGFETIFFKFIPHENKVLSNKISMTAIYNLIADGEDEWAYVFEDDINILENITMEEIIELVKLAGKTKQETEALSKEDLFEITKEIEKETEQ